MKRGEASAMDELQKGYTQPPLGFQTHQLYDEGASHRNQEDVQAKPHLLPADTRDQKFRAIQQQAQVANSSVGAGGSAPSSIVDGSRQKNMEEKPSEDLKVKRSQSFPLKEKQKKEASNSRHQPSIEENRRLESENKELRNIMATHKATASSLQNALAQSKADQNNLQRRLEEATATIFRLRPQRQEPTESEIEGDYRLLSESIKNWVEMNCEEFLDDEEHGFEIMETDDNIEKAKLEPFEIILTRFQSKSEHGLEVKEHVLVAVIMRYLFDRILNWTLPIILKDKEYKLLRDVYDGLKVMDPPKDLVTRRTWKCDTTTAIDNHKEFAGRYHACEDALSRDMWCLLQQVLPRGHEAAVIMASIRQEVITPAVTLGRKLQAAISIWQFNYSAWRECKSGVLMAKMPKFLGILQDYRCINLAAKGKLLKPSSDLATAEQQKSLLYLLDVFPGLYCQRVTAEGPQLLSTVTQPVLLVTFSSRNPTASASAMNSVESSQIMSNSSSQPTSSVQQFRPSDNDHGIARDHELLNTTVQHRGDRTPAPRDQRQSSAETEYMNSGVAINDGSQHHARSRYQTERTDVKETGRGRGQGRPNPAPKDPGIFERLMGNFVSSPDQR